MQYPLLRRLYELCRPDPMLYLHLQSVARHTPWASLDEVDGRYLIEAFFFFADHVLTLLERLLFLWYEDYPADFRRRAAADLQARLGFEKTEAELADLLAQLGENNDADVARPLGEVRDRMYGEVGLTFTERLMAK